MSDEDIYLGKYTELIRNIVESYNNNDRITTRMYIEEFENEILKKQRDKDEI